VGSFTIHLHRKLHMLSWNCSLVIALKLTNWLTTRIKILPEKLISRSASQGILILMNRKVYYFIHKSPHLVPVLSQINSVHTLSLFLKINLNINLPFTPLQLKWSLPFRIFDQNFRCIRISPMRSKSPAHFILHDLISLLIFSERIML
jgi:hypothetical protein